MKQDETGRPTYPVFRIPVVLASLTVFGLVAGLLGEGWLDALSWVGLGIPVLVCVYKSA
jgi:hypothetical protein